MFNWSLHLCPLPHPGIHPYPGLLALPLDGDVGRVVAPVGPGGSRPASGNLLVEVGVLLVGETAQLMGSRYQVRASIERLPTLGQLTLDAVQLVVIAEPPPLDRWMLVEFQHQIAQGDPSDRYLWLALNQAGLEGAPLRLGESRAKTKVTRSGWCFSAARSRDCSHRRQWASPMSPG